MMLLVASALALTLEEAVRRAAEVDPSVVIAAASLERARLDTVGSLGAVVGTPTAYLARTGSDGDGSTTGSVTLTSPVLDPATPFALGARLADQRGARFALDATTLDAQYVVAELYYAVLSAEAALDAARQGEELASATARASQARVAAGMDSELVGKSAQLGLLAAQAEQARAEAGVAIARARLEHALRQPVDDLEVPPLPELPAEPGRSPWLEVYVQNLVAARYTHGQRLAELLPYGGITASTTLLDDEPSWSLTLSATWSFDGLWGPVVRARQAAIDRDIARLRLDALERELELGLREARARALAADRVYEAARAREELAADALRIGTTRLEVGLSSTLEVLRLQDEAAGARAERVAAELERAVARLAARRIAGLTW